MRASPVAGDLSQKLQDEIKAGVKFDRMVVVFEYFLPDVMAFKPSDYTAFVDRSRRNQMWAVVEWSYGTRDGGRLSEARKLVKEMSSVMEGEKGSDHIAYGNYGELR